MCFCSISRREEFDRRPQGLWGHWESCVLFRTLNYLDHTSSSCTMVSNNVPKRDFLRARPTLMYHFMILSGSLSDIYIYILPLFPAVYLSWSRAFSCCYRLASSSFLSLQHLLAKRSRINRLLRSRCQKSFRTFYCNSCKATRRRISVWSPKMQMGWQLCENSLCRQTWPFRGHGQMCSAHSQHLESSSGFACVLEPSCPQHLAAIPMWQSSSCLESIWSFR